MPCRYEHLGRICPSNDSYRLYCAQAMYKVGSTNSDLQSFLQTATAGVQAAALLDTKHSGRDMWSAAHCLKALVGCRRSCLLISSRAMQSAGTCVYAVVGCNIRKCCATWLLPGTGTDGALIAVVMRACRLVCMQRHPKQQCAYQVLSWPARSTPCWQSTLTSRMTCQVGQHQQLSIVGNSS